MERRIQTHNLKGEDARIAQLDNILDKLENPNELKKGVKTRRRLKQATALGHIIFTRIDSVVKWATKTK